ncbi:hypothetical protein [Cupriavidus lacunae]|uniref:Uncharacterized protein n=1 Tax=Cupriavidus lacunae TaxID=2666307 RepID=A0A370NP15_9BURK|nr:hypothetical protein [Cupriavidus lacunae]RDK07268.1 hypothetical protein DN412_27205 [Cupriavidus lacunae]
MTVKQYGSSIEGTANDVAFALNRLRGAGIQIICPTDTDLRKVACQILGVSDDVGIESHVDGLAQSIVEASQTEVGIEQR